MTVRHVTIYMNYEEFDIITRAARSRDMSLDMFVKYAAVELAKGDVT